MATIYEEPIYSEVQERRGNAFVTLVLFAGAVVCATGFLYTMHLQSLSTAKQEGRQQVISAVGGMYAACTLEPIKRNDNGKPFPDAKCAALYEAYTRLADSYATK